MARLRRLVFSDRYFLVNSNPLRTRRRLDDRDFVILASVIQARGQAHGFLLTAWVFLPNHWHAIISARCPQSISLLLESIKVSSTRQINAGQKESGRLWQGRFFDRAPRTVKEYNQRVEYIHSNPARRGLVKGPDEWPWSSAREYAGVDADE